MSSSKQNIFIIVVAVLLIAGAVLATVFFSGRMPEVFDHSSSKAGHQNITMTDAVLTCEREVRDKFGQSLKDLMVDNRSSRYSKGDFAYRVYLEIQIADKKQNTTGAYVNCYVHATRGKITTFEVHNELDSSRNK